jgi:hypothetical protein
MKKRMRFFLMLLAVAFMAGTMTSCSVFEKGGPDATKSFKHKKPLPKKYIIPNKSSKVLK